MEAQNQEKVIKQIKKELSKFFVLTEDGQTEYIKNSNSGIVHSIVTAKISQKFKQLSSEKNVGNTKLKVDFWSESDKIAYEMLLGDGNEIWKDVWKAILIGASKLIVFCRNYGGGSMSGYRYVNNCKENMKPYLEGKLDVQVVLIPPALR